MSDRTPGASRPPGPRGFLRSTLGFQRSPLDLVGRLLSEYGDVCSLDLYPVPLIVVNHPDYIDRVLKARYHNYDRGGPVITMARNLFGDGLIMASEPRWLFQRRMLQPAFHRKRVEPFGELMTDTIAQMLDRWEQVRATDRPIDIRSEMGGLTLRIVTRVLFATDLDGADVRRFLAAVVTANRELAAFIRFPFPPLSVRTPGHRRFHDARTVVDDVTYAMIRSHRRDDSDRNSLLSMMMRAHDDVTGARLDDRQLRDEVFTMLFAGHETTAGTLAWLWHLVGRHPDVELRLREEVDRVLAGRRPTMADLARLSYTRQVIDETLRLYPPAWQSYRQAVSDDEIGGFRIRAGSTVFWSSYHLHRHRDYWDDPERFDPDRFAAASVGVHASAYIPFGAGPRVCIGNRLAMAEMQFAIAMILQRYQLVPTEHAPITPRPLLALDVSRPVTVRLRPRAGQPSSTRAPMQNFE
ncbi:MAG: cytochrome P450 [Mycobacteriaceae bacterium]|nr:cytochrome P450 [Mycobacteriaceae bacterium]